MRFGQKISKIKYGVFLLVISSIVACNNDPVANYSSFIQPENGTTVPSGKPLDVNIDFAKNKKIDSVVYMIDSDVALVKTDTLSVQLNTENLKLGNHLLTARIYGEAESEDLTANFILLANKAPEQFGYKIIKTYPHATDAYTQGLEFHNGILFESTGEYGTSSIRKVDLNSGKILKQTNLPEQFFGEGMTIVDDEIVMITYKEKTGFVFDKNTLAEKRQFPYTVGQEGWGLVNNGEYLLNSDGTNTIYFLDSKTYQKVSSISVYDHRGAVGDINELEWINGKIYANVYTTNKIVVIDPKTGAVEAEMDMDGLLAPGYFKTVDDIGNNVFNGIAYDKVGKRIFVTGKKWPNLYHVEFIKK